MLREGLVAYGLDENVADLLSKLMTLHNRIPQGSPLSCDALNFFMHRIDCAIESFCRGKAVVTRVADDIVISGDNREFCDSAAVFLEEQIAKYGLVISSKKKISNGTQLSSQKQLVHNILVNSPFGTGVRAEYVAEALMVGNEYVRRSRTVTESTLLGLAELRQKLFGWINYCSQASRGPARHLGNLLCVGDRRVSTALRKAGVTRMRKWWVKTKQIDRPKELVERFVRVNEIHSKKADC